MKPDEQRIAIAEWVGWKQREKSHRAMVPCGNQFSYDNFFWNDPHGRPDKGPPDYLNDLNAMHEAEGLLKGSQIRDFEISLIKLLNLPLESTPYEGSTFPLIHATAAQRTEALLKTLGLWRDNEKEQQ